MRSFLAVSLASGIACCFAMPSKQQTLFSSLSSNLIAGCPGLDGKPRVSTLDNEGAHRLGIEHVENIIRNNPEQKRVYHGFAKLKAQIVYSEKCNIVKDDINGTKPYHTMQILSTLEIRG